MANFAEQTQELSVGIPSTQKLWKSVIILQSAVLLTILAFYYWHIIRRLIYIWSNNPDWSHGFIIPLFGIYYLYLQRDRLPRNISSQVWTSRIIGMLLLTASFLLYLYCTFVQIEYPKNLSLIISLAGIILMVWGWPISRWSWFAVAFLVFAMPLPQRLYQQMTMPLREIAAIISGTVLSFIPGMMTDAQGTVVEYIYKGTAGTLDIERACSGMRLMMTMSALGVAMAFIHERPIWQRLIMILACVPIAIFCNIIRVTTTGFFYVFGLRDLARGFWHTMLGLGMLAIAFSLYGAISYVLQHLFVDDTSEQESDPALGGASE